MKNQNLIGILNLLPDHAEFKTSKKWFILENWLQMSPEDITDTKLKECGYSYIQDYTGGDRDMLIIDLENKTYTFGENGFYPYFNIYDIIQTGKNNLFDLNAIRA